MAEGIEIVIDPRKLIIHGAYIAVIIVLIILLIVHWGDGSCNAEKNKTKETATLGAGLNLTNQTNQTVNATTQLASLCTNGVKDQDETDIDCGGSKCSGCGENKLCNADTDCGTGFFCYQDIKCRKPSCTDSIKNQDETDVDCGGKCGGYWYDSKCNSAPKPTYSGKVDLSIISVGTSVKTFATESFAKIDNVKFTVSNGKNAEALLTAYVYARKESGTPYYESQISGDEIPVVTKEIPSLALGANFTDTLNISKTLTETDPSDNYRIVVQLRDAEDNLITEATWTNP